ncbi:hypothetical protein SRABI111_03768 [Pseudomonas carnis]|jgi:hypothetical protein|nr:hypothetical protein SRABI111_03768 [Pseudomonas carnis]CAH0323308.1 hypothetical protein SRABI08_05634 [Pseudomonas carnis]CAH0324662.1 hypothetical protein SRABI110_06000 [Pseudomonas carnis]CAH0325764.1 hypothetical protein SRABI64_06024 [Pseudomonas carnis]
MNIPSWAINLFVLALVVAGAIWVVPYFLQ